MYRDDIIYLLKQLNEKLRLREIFGEIYILGGSAICLAYDGDRATKDIDALFHPKTEIYELIYEIADDEQISYDWLNDGVKGFIDDNYEFDPFDNLSNLKIYVANAEYLFAMKCLSCRTDNDRDKSDIKFLIKYLNLINIEDACEILNKYYPISNKILPKTQYMLEEIFSDI